MKKIFFILVVFVIAIGVEKSAAQSGANNNSDWKVPVPTPSLPQSPAGATTGGGGIIATGSTTSTPVPPSLNISTPIVSPIATVTASSIVPSLPVAPVAPPIPTAAAVAAVPTVAANISLPTLPTLPPVPPIPPVPELRLVIR